jgi:hypothetical protein
MHFKAPWRLNDQTGTLTVGTHFPDKPWIFSLGPKDIDSEGVLQ